MRTIHDFDEQVCQLNASRNPSLKNVAGLGQCKNLHTLDLSGCTELKNVSALRQCNLHTTPPPP